MAVIVDIALPAQQFELGRILGMRDQTSVILETMVPLGERTVPFFRVHGGENGFEATVQGRQAVNDIELISTHDGEILYALGTAVVWETQATHFIDDISVELRPR